MKYPFDTLKIDKSFVDEVTTNPDTAAVVGAIVSLCKVMMKNVIAE